MKQGIINRESVLIPCKGRDFQNVEVKVMYDKGEWRSDWPYKKYLVQEVDRKNPKRFKDLADKVLSRAQEIADKFLSGDYEAVWDYIPEV